MPCRDYSLEDMARADARSAQREARRADDAAREANKQAKELQERCDLLTRMLCYVVTKAVDEEVDNLILNNEVRDWYIEHRAADLANMRKLMQNVDLDALTKEEFDTVDRILGKYQPATKN